MSTEKNSKAETYVVGGPARFSYAYVFQARTNQDTGKNEYSVSILIPKKDKALVAKVKDGIAAAVKYGVEKRKEWGGKKPNGLRNPLRDGDEEKDGDAVYKGMYFITAKNTIRPGVVDEDLNKIMDEEEFYSGCWGNFAVNFYPYGPTKGNVGIGVSLQNLQKTKDDEKLSGGRSAEEDFGGGTKKASTTDEDEDDEDNPFA